jgi:hypothetical protein
MFRFDRLTCRDTIVRDVMRSYPQTIPISGRLRFRPACDGCDFETVVRKSGFNSPNVVRVLNRAAFGFKADIEDHASD